MPDPAREWDSWIANGEPDRFTTYFCWCGKRAVADGLCSVHFDRQAEEESLFAAAPIKEIMDDRIQWQDNHG